MAIQPIDPALAPRSSAIGNYFSLRVCGSTIRTEIVAGIVMYLSVAYILNLAILAQAGIPFGAALVATATASTLATLAIGLRANLPFAVAPRLTMVPVRQKIIASAPARLESAIAATVGIFVLTTGLRIANVAIFSPGGWIEPGALFSFTRIGPYTLVLLTGVAVPVLLSWQALHSPAAILVSIVTGSCLDHQLGLPSHQIAFGRTNLCPSSLHSIFRSWGV